MLVKGSRIGPYALQKIVFRGNRFNLWSAARADGKERRPQIVAIRVLKDPADREGALRLNREYHRLKELSDGPVPHVHALYEGHGALAMEWMEGTRVADVLRAREASAVGADDASITEIGLSLLRVLRFAHSRTQPVSHGHLSPSHLLLDPSGKLLVLGWGGWGSHPWAPGQAPESRARSVIEPATDIFGAGVLLSALFEPRALRASGLKSTIDVVAQRWPAMGRFLEEMTAFSPLERPASCDVAISRLLTLARQQGGVSRIASLAQDTSIWLRDGKNATLFESLDSSSPEPPTVVDPASSRKPRLPPPLRPPGQYLMPRRSPPSPEVGSYSPTDTPSPSLDPAIPPFTGSGRIPSSFKNPAIRRPLVPATEAMIAPTEPVEPVNIERTDPGITPKSWRDELPEPLLTIESDSDVVETAADSFNEEPCSTSEYAFLEPAEKTLPPEDAPRPARIDPIIEDEPSMTSPTELVGVEESSTSSFHGRRSSGAELPEEEPTSPRALFSRLTTPEWVAIVLVGLLLLGLAATLLHSCGN